MDYNLEQRLETIAYDDAEKLQDLLVGQKIVSVNRTTESAMVKKLRDEQGYDLYYSSHGRDEFEEVLEFFLSGGITLRAHANDGGCGCDNGCFTAKLSEEDERRLIGATILSVRTEERRLEYRKDADGNWDYQPEGEPIINGKRDEDRDEYLDGSAEIKVFVYTDLASTQPVKGEDPSRVPLVSSYGGDNGYYGWGFTFSVDRTIVVQEGGERRGIEG